MIDPQTLGLHMIVQDEEQLLRPLLLHVARWMDEIIILDTGSMDATLRIAREFTDKVFMYPLDMNFSKARNRALEKATTTWVFQVDADEWPTIELLRWIKQGVVRGLFAFYDGIRVMRENLVAGQKIGENSYEWHTRVFRRGYRFVGRIHESINVPPERLRCAPEEFFLLHHKSQSRQEMQNARYEQWEEQRAITQARR
jgi:glycosyltransferase involved in cell wall biosynthesis